MKVVMVGAGYVGLTTGACFAELGHNVTCVDIDAARIQKLAKAQMPFFEPGLEELIGKNVKRRRLSFSASIAASVADADLVFFAVGTPSGPGGEIDLSYIEAAARQVAPVLKPNAVVVIKSTVVAGTAKWLREIIAEARGGLDFSLASNPEFLREGSAIKDFLEADRIVVGADDPRAGAMLERLYAPLKKRGIPFILTTSANAELIKYAANALLALKIGFINDVANLCEKVGGDIAAVSLGIGLDKRIGTAFLSPGPGFGGSCFPKDTRAFAATGRQHGAPQALVETLIERNEERKRSLGRRVLAELGGMAEGAVVAVLGFAFKADTDDIRESAALSIVPILREAGVSVRAHDPEAAERAEALLPDLEWHDSPYEAARGADLVLILTEWNEYRALDLRRLSHVMAGRTLVDYRNLFSPKDAAENDLRYVSLGRPAIPASSPLAMKPGKTARPAALSQA